MSANQVPLGLKLLNSLDLRSCPHCGRANPSILLVNQVAFVKVAGHLSKEQIWGVYYCSSCGKLIVAASSNGGGSEVTEVYPVPKSVAEELPEKAKGF